MAEPEELDAPFDPVDFTLAQRRQTLGNTFASLDDDPEKAARAQELSAETGHPPALVYGDLENFEKQHKAALAGQILNNNAHLRSYLDDEPLASKISNDDYGQLDAVSSALATYAGPADSILKAGVRGYREMANLDHLESEHDKLATMLASNPVFANIFVRQAALAGAATFAGTMAVATGVIGGAAAMVGETYKQIGGASSDADKLTRDLIIMAQVGLSGQAGLHGVVNPKVKAMIDEAARVAKTVEPYVTAGKEPPVGLHPIVDEFKVEQAKLDADALGEALKEASKSATRERSPDLFAAYVRQITDGDIGVSADAVRKLYGDKVPALDDGLLGFVPDLAAQLQRAEATGGDIRVSVADWLARVEPEVAKELKDHVRARPEGMTVEEGKVHETPEGVAGGPVDSLRQTAGLQGIQERKLTLKRGKDIGEARVFSMYDASGADIGELYIAEEKGGKRLYVDDIRSKGGPQSLGPRAMRDVIEQIKEQFPDAETLEGARVSGARYKADAENEMASIDLTKIKPRAKLPEEPKSSLAQRAKDAIVGKSEEQVATEAKALDEREAFDKASAIGMTVDQYKRYQKLIERRAEEDTAKAESRAMADQRKRQTAEWKANRAELKPQVREDYLARPEVELDEMLRDGRVKLDKEGLTDDQLARLPKDYLSADGIHIEDLANLFGDTHPAGLVDRLIALTQAREASGMKPKDFLARSVEAETDRQMEARYGSLDRNILEEAKDQVLSETQEALLHEETLARATEAGLEYSIGKEELKAAIRDFFDRSLAKEVSTDRALAESGRAARATEMALLKGDYAEAFRQKQRQYNAIVTANLAKQFEKEQVRFEKTAKKYSGREVKSVEQSAVNYIQQMLSQAGVKMRLSPDEIAAGIQHEGYASFPDYVADKAQMGWEPAVSEWIQEGQLGQRTLDKMTVAEFREFKDAVDSLDHIGRAERKVNLLGEKMDWSEFQSKVIENLETLPMRPREGQGRWLYKVDAALTRMEELVKDFDLRQELGPIYSAVIEPMMASKAKAFDLMTDLSKHFKETRGDFGGKWRRSLNDTIPQDFIIDSYSKVPLDMARENLINAMLNWGNRSNIEKLTRGYASLELGRVATKAEAAAFEVKMKLLIDTHAREQDWAFVSRMWEPFKTWQPLIDTVSRNTSGVAPKWIKAEPITTPHGEIEGGYWPVKYDRLGSDMNVVEDRKLNVEGLFGPSYIRATTAKGHLKSRTGYVDFVDLHNSVEQAASVMQQSIHDIAFRDSLIQASKVFYDKPIRAAIRKHYGTEYEAQLVPWLKRIANQYTSDEQAIQGLNGWLRRVRINLVGHALPLNLKVILSPDIGVPNPKAWASFEANRAENVKFAMEHSNEIRHLVYNMDRDFREQLERSVQTGTWDSFQAKAVQWGFVPVMKVSQEFRMSTFIDQYARAKTWGRTDHEASVIADSYVRERHGAASVVDLPSVMQSNEALKQITMFYGYFNTMYNWQRQLLGNVRRGEVKQFLSNGLGSVVVGAAFGAALFNQAKESDSWWKIVGKALLLQPLQTIPIVRDAANYLFEGFPTRTPSGSLISAGGAVATDLKRLFRGEQMKKPIQTAANLLGPTTGLPLAQIGRTGQFVYDVYRGKQRPRNFMEYVRGIIHGEARLKP